VTITHLGCPGHLIVSGSCRWHRHTQIGTQWRVSSIGDYYPGRGAVRDTVGAAPNAYFETMVFRTTDVPTDGSEGCGCLEVESFAEIEVRQYVTAGEAQVGHDAMVAKYAAGDGQ